MARENRGLLSWMMNHISSFRRLLISLMIAAIGYGILITVLWNSWGEDIQKTNAQLAGLQYQRNLRTFLHYLNTHHFLVKRELQGNLLLQDQIFMLQKEASEELRFIDSSNEALDRFPVSSDLERTLDRTSNVGPAEIDRLWKNLRRGASSLGIEESNSMHKELMEKIQALMDKTASRARLNQHNDLLINDLVALSSLVFPQIHLLLFQVDDLSEQWIKQKEHTTELKNSLLSFAGSLQGNLDLTRHYSQEVLDYLGLESAYYQEFAKKFDVFQVTLQEFIEFIQEEILTPGKEGPSLPDWQGRSTDLFQQLFGIWEEVARVAEAKVHQEKDRLMNERLWIFAISSLFVVLGSILGLFFTSQDYHSLRNLEATAREISRGNLKARVPVLYRDEMGRVCITFNHMAYRLSSILGQFRELLKAIQKLSRGDYTARAAIAPEADRQVKEVGAEFNRMADSFETIVGRLHRLVIDLTSSATEIAASSKQHEATVSEQGATTKQISITATQISATAQEFATTLSEVGRTAEQTASLAKKGQTSLQKMELAMRKMDVTAETIASRLSILNDKADKITGVITTIGEFSAQTNLLSLNAAIEAEKAGEAGKSFSVIAREIRSLSSQTAQSTTDIEVNVNDIVEAIRLSVLSMNDFVNDIREGANNVNEVSSQLKQIMEQVGQLVARFEQVNLGMRQQASGAEQINTALKDLSEMAKETSLSMTQFHNTIEHLDKAAQDIRETLSRVK